MKLYTAILTKYDRTVEVFQACKLETLFSMISSVEIDAYDYIEVKVEG
jgi:hypothetical protein